MKPTVTVTLTILCLCAGLAFACSKNKNKPKSPGVQISAVASQLKKVVKKEVKDKTRRDRTLLLIDDMFLAKAKYSKEFFRVQNLLLSNPDLTRKEANALAADFAKVRIDSLREGAALKIQMREHVTEQEWTAIFKKMKKKKGKAKPTDDTEPAPKKAEGKV